MLKTVGNPSTRFGNQTIDSGDLIIGTSGNGVDFAATPGPTGSGAVATSEKLTDYEEGTWSPQYTNTTPPTTPYTMEVVFAKYVKIGRLVVASAWIRTDNVNTAGAAGSLLIAGLPYAGAGSNNIHSGSIGSAANFNINHPSSLILNQGNITLVYRATANGATSACTAADLITGASADKNEIRFTVSYFIN